MIPTDVNNIYSLNSKPQKALKFENKSQNTDSKKEIMMDESEPEKPKIHFKSIKKKRPIRQKDSSDEEESVEAVDKDAFEEILEIQKLRKRSKGVSAGTLASGKKVSKIEELIDSDPFKLKSGGLLTLDQARKGKAAEIGDEEREDEIATQFSKETRVRDEDGEMQKFIETEMEKRSGKRLDSDQNEPEQYMPPEEMALLSLPEHLKIKSKKNEEMLSSQMLSGQLLHYFFILFKTRKFFQKVASVLLI